MHIKHLRRPVRGASPVAAILLALLASPVLTGCTDGPNVTPAASLEAASPSGGTTPPSSSSVAIVPSPSASPRPPADDHAPLIVYRYGQAAVDLFTLDAFTGASTSMGRLQRGAQVAGQSIHWAADRRSAFVFSDSDSVSARVDVPSASVDALRLGPSPSRDAVSPAGNVIARLNDGNDIDLLDLNGRPIRTLRLPNGITPMLNIMWSPDATTIAVSSCLPCVGRLDGPWHVFLAPVDGGPVRQVGDVDTAYIGIDDWSADGARILYENSVCGGDPCSGGIAILDLATGAATQLTSRGESAVSWSPDGERIVFDSGFGGSELSVMDSSGDEASRQVIATAEPGFGFDDPVWSPNGDWILYRLIPMDGFEQTGIGDLWMVPSRGGEPRLVIEAAIADW